jgi:hypothetical protein
VRLYFLTDEEAQGRTPVTQGEALNFFGEQYADSPFVKAAPSLDENDFDYDDNPLVSEGDDGAYVNVWVWVSNEDAGINPKEPTQ